MYVRTYVCACLDWWANSYQDTRPGPGPGPGPGPEHAPPEKREEHTTTGKNLYIGIFADNEKKYKKVKKNLELRKNVVTLHQKQTTTKTTKQ